MATYTRDVRFFSISRLSLQESAYLSVDGTFTENARKLTVKDLS
jgi:hypothetical protein